MSNSSDLSVPLKFLKAMQNDDFDESEVSLVPLKKLPGKLYISGLEGLSLTCRIKRDVIVSLCNVPCNLNAPDRVHHIFMLQDDANEMDAAKMKAILPKAAEIIHQALIDGKTVLVNCAQGMSRSATVVLYYLEKYYLANTDDQLQRRMFKCLKYLKKYRPCIRPNDRFLQILFTGT